MDEIKQILQWLCDGDEHEAAKILEQCSLIFLYIDTLFEIGGEQEYELMDIDIQAPRKIIKELSTSLHPQAEQIETAIRECSQSTGFYIRNINWVPKLITEINPAADQITACLANIDSAHVHEAWRKALDRKNRDPEGAITAARTLVESVCKHILDKEKVSYPDDADLPKLYYLTAECLKLAPNQQADKIFRQILGNTQAVISGLAYMRNELGDAHGKRSSEIKPDTIHAELAVNLAGTLATFIVSTWEKLRKEPK
jgi:hypothetical protein